MYRQPANKGARCQRWQRVPGRGGRRRLLRCADFKTPRRGFMPGFQPGHVPANRGRQCLKFQNVYSPWFDHRVVRCKSYGGVGRGNGYGYGRPGLPLRPARGPLVLPPGPRMVRAPLIAPRPAGWMAIFAPKRPYRAGEGYIPYFTMPSLERLKAGRTPR